jgi:hypothetical protein
MAEAQWLACANSTEALGVLGRKASERKLRLFGCACCRTAGLLADALGRRVVETAERYADGCAPAGELAAAGAEADAAAAAHDAAGTGGARLAEVARAAGAAAHADALEAARGPSWHIARAEIWRRFSFQTRERWRCIEGKFQLAERRRQMVPLRCIFGNPFRPVKFDKNWGTDTAFALARQLYESRDFSAMPILADALQDAGCDSEDVLNHCRDANATHVRGCWVVDLVLGKE